MERREFLQGIAGVAVAGATAARNLAEAGEGSTTMLEETGTSVRVGIVGCGEGTHGKVWAEMLAAPGGERFGILPARVWDDDPSAAEAVAGATGAECVGEPRQVAEGMDGVLITELAPDRYLELSRPFLEAGMRVFYNRPFAGSLADAREILRVAREHGARVYSASALLHTAAGESAVAGLPALGAVRLFHVTGPTDHLGFYLPHCIACLVSVLGTGVARVQAVSLTPRADEPRCAEAPVVVYVEYGADAAVGPVRGTLSMLGPGARWYGFVLKLYGTAGESDETRFEVSYDRLLHSLARFLRTGEEPVAHEVLLETTAIYYAALESAREGGRAVSVR